MLRPMVAPTAVLMLLDGAFAPVPVTTEAFQLPSGTGSVSGSFLVAEHTVSAYLIGSLSLPELSRYITSSPIFYDFASTTLKGVSPVDGGYFLAPGLSDHAVYVGTNDAPTSVALRFSDDSFGHILPPPAVPGEYVWLEIKAADSEHTAWAGSVLCTSQSTPTLPPSLSLKELRAIVRFESGAIRVLIPESSISMSISILGLLMTIFYLVVIANETETLLDKNKNASSALVAENISKTTLKLFLMNGPTNSLSGAIGGLITTGSAIQTFRETVVLVYSLAAFIVSFNALFGWSFIPVLNNIKAIPVATLRILVETCLLSSIALPMGVFSKLSQFTSTLVAVAMIGIAMRNHDRITRVSSWPIRLTDLLFRIAVIFILAPCIIFPVFVTSSVEHRTALYLAWPSMVFCTMLASLIAHTRLDRPGVLSKTDFRLESEVVQCSLFVALTVLLKPLAFSPEI